MADQKKVNLRMGPRLAPGTGPAPAPIEVDVPGLKGTLPFMPGRAIGSGRDVPSEVRAEEQRIKDEPIVTPEHMKAKAIQPPEVVQLEDLPEEKQAEVLENVKQAMSRPQVRQQPFIPRGPGISQAKQLADRVAAQTEERIRQAQTTPKAQPKPQPAPKPAAQVTQPPPPPKPQPKPVAVEQPVEQPAPTPDIPPLSESGAANAEPLICVHCGWPVGSKEGCDPTTLDKQVFVASVLGQKRFSKEYELLGGQLRVVFRTLTVEENDLVIKQLIEDWNSGKISGPAHSVAEATKYQMCLALDSIETNVGPITLPTREEYEYDEPEQGTILPEIVGHVYKTALPHEQTRRIVAKAYGHFIETQSKLEAMAENPDFWQATGA